MRADSPGARGTGLLLVLALLCNACASLTPPPGRGMRLRHTPGEAMGPALAGELERPHTRRGSREAVTAVGPVSDEGMAGPRALASHLAFRAAVGEVSGSTRRISGELSRLRGSRQGIGGRAGGIFVRYVEYGEAQLRWIDAELSAATRLATAASDPVNFIRWTGR